MSGILADRKRLLLTGTAPGPEGVGGIILHDLESFLPPGSLAVLHVADGSDAARDTRTAHGNPMRVLGCRFERRPGARFGKVGKAFDWLRMTLANRWRIAATVRACVDYARGQHVEEIWAVLDTPASIAVAARVAGSLGLPLRALVWDDIEHNVRYFGLDRFTAAACRRNFETAIRASTSLAVIGETMREEYQRRYGKQGVILRHGADSPPCRSALQGREDAAPTVCRSAPQGRENADATGRSSALQRREDTPIRIGFAGSVTARSAFQCLLQALDHLGWAVDGRAVTLVLMGQRFDLWSSVPRRIECHGYRSVDDTIGLLAGCDVNYLPQPFEQDWRPFSEFSFPSKTTTYLAAGAPILLHAPPHASLPAFFERYPFGALVNQLDAQALGEALRGLCVDPSLRTTAINAGARALTEKFSVECFRTSFADFLDTELPARVGQRATDEPSEAPTPCAASPVS